MEQQKEGPIIRRAYETPSGEYDPRIAFGGLAAYALRPVSLEHDPPAIGDTRNEAAEPSSPQVPEQRAGGNVLRDKKGRFAKRSLANKAMHFAAHSHAV